MGDSRRFDLLAKVIKNHFPISYKIADVAGGKGYLNLALSELGYDVTTFDRRSHPVNRIKYRQRYFNGKIGEEFHLLIGMHPDEATNVIIWEAAIRNIPFVIVPCCIKPMAFMFGMNHKFNLWFNHLKHQAHRLGYKTEEFQLAMSGRNLGLIGRF